METLAPASKHTVVVGRREVKGLCVGVGERGGSICGRTGHPKINIYECFELLFCHIKHFFERLTFWVAVPTFVVMTPGHPGPGPTSQVTHQRRHPLTTGNSTFSAQLHVPPPRA